MIFFDKMDFLKNLKQTLQKQKKVIF